MSQENVELVIRAHQLSRSDPESFFSICDPGIEWDMSRLMPEARVYYGHDGVREFWRSWVGTWDDFDFQLEQAIDGGGDQVVTSVHQVGSGRGSGVAVEQRFGQVWTVRSGRIVRFRAFPSFEEALEALGLSEWEDAEQRGLAEAGIGALNSGDLEAFLALTAEDVEFTSMVAEAEGTTFRGHDGVRAWWETVRGAFEDVRWDLLDIRGSGDRGVLHFRMTGTLGSVPVEQTMWQATALRDGKVIWWAFFRSEREALEAIGLRE
jgi:ketosteroid isomerase-like protein